MAKFLLSPIFVIIISLSIAAQSDVTDMYKAYAKEQLKYDELQLKYDKFKDTTDINLTLLLSGEVFPFEGISLMTGVKFDGKIFPDTRKDILLIFLNNEKVAKIHTVAPSLIFLADNKRIRLENKVFVSDKEGHPSKLEVGIYSLPLENLKQFASAKVLEGQLGEKEFTLNQKQLLLLKDLWSKIAPPVKRRSRVSH
jgi:hypothetical protein